MTPRPPLTGPMAELHRLMGEAAQAFGRGNLALAASGAEQALRLAPDMPEALHLLGLCHLKRGDAPRALALLREAAERKPGDAQLMHNLGVASVETGDAAGARVAFKRATELDPHNPEAWFNLAVVSEEQGDALTAEQGYRESLKHAPERAAATAGLAALLEQRSELQEAGEWSDTALRLDPQDPVANLTRAQLDFRGGEHEAAAARLERLLQAGLTPRNRALAAGRLGAVYDRLDRPAEAWRRFEEAKAALGEAGATPAVGIYSFPTAARMARYLGRLLEPGPAAEGPMPAFLVGFPRSGTTLLDQMLSGHTGIAVLEEQDTLQDVLREHTLSDAGMDAFLRLDAAGLEGWRRRYWQRVTEFMPDRPRDAVFVDKLPLNSVFMPLIRRLFPGARFIFALRDPRDVVLSCFMQSFALNEAMRHFLTLRETGEYYAAVMRVGADALEKLPEAVHRIRYEDVVQDAEAEARRLLEFLGLSWEPKVLDFQETAKKRRINTPSYHQVAQPIYSSAKQRWKRYEAQLGPVLPVLEPFVKRFGYLQTTPK
ncbi:MAG: tetratricopeptide repeat-containing sulfotransferase family protein [Bacillota bacterium]